MVEKLQRVEPIMSSLKIRDFIMIYGNIRIKDF